MRNLGFFICLALLLTAPAKAVEKTKTAEPIPATAVSENPSAPAEDELIEIEIQTVQPVEQAKDIAPRPECSDSALSDGVIKKIAAYQAEHPANMQIEKRRDILLLKNLKNFKEVQVKNFTAAQDYAVANALIMTKINKGLTDADLRLCKSLGKGRAENIYALIYPVGDGHVVDIINFLPEGSRLSDFSFIFN